MERQLRFVPVAELKDARAPSQEEAEAKLHQEGYESYCWYDVPGAGYPRHQHAYDECLWILKGKITFHVGEKSFPLEPGDRLYLPAGTPHSAEVPAKIGVTFLVGQKKSEL